MANELIPATNNQSPDLASPVSPAVVPGQIFSTTTGASIDSTSERRGFDFRHFWHSLVEKIWVVVLCVVAGLFLGLGYLASTPKLYQCHSVLEVDVQEPSLVESDRPSARPATNFLATEEALRTIEQNLVNRSLLTRVIHAEGLANDGGGAFLGLSEDKTKPSATPSSRPPAAASSSAAGSMPPSFTPLEEAMAGALGKNVKPAVRRNTRLIDLYVTNHDPVIAQRLAEAVSREYIRSSIERRMGLSQQSLRYLLEEEERLKNNLRKSEAAVAEYKEKTPDALQLGGGAAATGSQTGAGSSGGRSGLVEDKLQELTSKLTATKSDRIRIQNELKQIEGIGDNVDALLAIPSIAVSPTVVDRRRDVSKDVKMTAVSVVEHSPLPHAPVSPSTSKTLVLGLLGGLAAGLAFIFGADAIDRSVKTVDQAEAVFGLPVLAAVPETKDEAKTDGERRVPKDASGYRVIADVPEGPAAEAFRNLRAALGLLGPESERKISLFTSAVPTEGKSFTSTNYAVALAQQGYRVLLIDGDLRRPSLHKVFGPAGKWKTNSKYVEPPGLVDCLIGGAKLESAARPISPEEIDVVGEAIALRGKMHTATGGQLYVLAGGHRAPNPAEILSGPSFARLIADAGKIFDRVVLDSAPILAVSDTLLMAPHVQTICMIIRARKTPRQAIQRALGLIAGTGTRPAGLVLNRLPQSRGYGYYYSYASPGYGKGEGSYSSSYSETTTQET